MSELAGMKLFFKQEYTMPTGRYGISSPLNYINIFSTVSRSEVW